MAKYIKEIARKLVDGSYENIAIGAKAENVITSHNITAEQILNTADIYNIEITVDKWVEGYDGTEIVIQDNEYTWEEILNKDIINLHFYAEDWGTNATNYFRREEGYSDLSSVTFVCRTLNGSSNEVMTHYLYAHLDDPYKFYFYIHRYRPATRLSEFNNDTNFITNTVDNLTNYYKKTETYTQTEINNLLNAITTLDIQVVTSKPENPNKTTIYLIGTGTDGDNDYEEWLYTDSGWELIGTTEIDLTSYYTKIEVDELLNDTYTFEVSSDDWYGLIVGGESLRIDESLYPDIERILDCRQIHVKVPGSDYPYIDHVFYRDSIWGDTEAYFSYHESMSSKVYQISATVFEDSAYIYISLRQDAESSNGNDLTLIDPQPYEEIV